VPPATARTWMYLFKTKASLYREAFLLCRFVLQNL